MNLIHSMRLYLENVSTLYGRIRADESKYADLQNCMDRVDIIEIMDRCEHARLLLLDRRLLQSLLPHLGYPEYFTLKAQLEEIMEACRSLELKKQTKYGNAI